MCNKNKKSAVSHREIKKSINIYVIILKIFLFFMIYIFPQSYCI